MASSSLSTLCREIAQQLADQQVRVVFAESCTAGLVAASLARVPGISQYLCGSAVTYRDDTKAQWLGISRRLLATSSAVSEPVAQRMAEQVLRRTPEATVAISITGHLGPQSPPALDGVVYLGHAGRSGRKVTSSVIREQLRSRGRAARQREAAERALRLLHRELLGHSA